MTAIYAPGIAQVVISGTVGVQPWASILHFQQGTSTGLWTLPVLTALCNAASTQWNASLGSVTGANVIMRRCTGVDIGSVAGVSYDTGPVANAGGTLANLEPSSLCASINYQIAQRYRGGHPRGFWPFGNMSQMQNESLWITTDSALFVSNLTGYIGTLISHANTAGGVGVLHVVPRYTYTYSVSSNGKKIHKERTGFVGAFPVNGYSCAPTVGTQRRRLTV